MNAKPALMAAFLTLACTACMQSYITAADYRMAGNMAAIETAAGDAETGFAGNFLSSIYAQNHSDWKTAESYLEYVLEQDPDNPELLKRAMILAAGSGDVDKAARYAQKMHEAQLAAQEHTDMENALAPLVLAIDSLQKKDHDKALSYLEQMPEGDMTSFIRPLLRSWIEAGKGNFEDRDVQDTSMHLYHTAVIGLFTDHRDKARVYAERMMKLQGMTPGEGERVADLMSALGEYEGALGLYKGLQIQGYESKFLQQKIDAIQNNKEALPSLLPPLQIKSAAQGAAHALSDLARILFQERGHSSSRLFINMALYLDPGFYEARLILAEILIYDERYEQAMEHLITIPESDPYFLEANRKAADLLTVLEQTERAKALLENLYKKHGDTESGIKIGDLYRNQENYKEALKAYNRIIRDFEGKVPEEYWYLLYARGISYERLGQWKEAEVDLQAALNYRPDHPYILNYLGYGWADQGVNLDESLEMIKRAVSLRPGDGYITDSLGWVYYMRGNYREALPHLERAVELLPYDPTINEHLGDVYWQTGRKLEAQFQWERALNYAEDETATEKLREKLKNGVPPVIHAAQQTQENNHQN